MKVDYIRFWTTDDVELEGWLSEAKGEVAAIHIHGMSGNGYENRFLDNLREMYMAQNISFFAIDTRGRGVVSSFWKRDGSTQLGGSCFEAFEESVHDIQGAINYLKSLGKKRFILQGHSLGCSKVVLYMTTQNTEDIKKVVLLAPTDMVGWANRDTKHEDYVTRAKALVTEGHPTDLVSVQCWPDQTPLSAQTYLSICVAGSSADIYGQREGGALLSRVATPTLIAYGTEDIGIVEIDGSVEAWEARVKDAVHPNTEIAFVKDASHSFAGYEPEVAKIVGQFISRR